MAYQEFDINNRRVTVYKRKSSRSLKITLGLNGQVKVSIPRWLPYQAGVDFAISKKDWINANFRPPRQLLPGQPVGKAHHLRFEAKLACLKASSRVTQNEIIISHPIELKASHPLTQAAAKKAATRALRSQAEALLPPRLKSLADKHHLSYSSLNIRQLNGRWGSCDQNQRIILNLFLMQLPWQLIDYVLIHELTHTEILSHGPAFWQAMTARLPNAKELRKELRGYQPSLI